MEAAEKNVIYTGQSKRGMTYGVGWGHPLEINIRSYHLNPFLTTWDTLPVLNGGLADEIPMDAFDVEGTFDSYRNRESARGFWGFGPSGGVEQLLVGSIVM